jgi:hypothetical protein
MTASIPPIQPRTIRLRNGLHFEFSEQGRSGAQTLVLLHGITDSWRSFEPVFP